MWCNIRLIILVLVLTAVAIRADNQHTASSRISNNGQDVTIGDYPFVAAIRVDNAFRCGGFIYNERWIVTAASCVNRITPTLVTVDAGIVSLEPADDTQQRSQVSSIKINPLYNETTFLNDIALVEIVPSFTFDEAVRFVYYDEQNTSSVLAEFVGWGTDEDGGSPSNQLKMATIHTALVTECATEYPDEYQSAYMICAGSLNYGDTQSPCQYDEGSPLIQNGYVIGILSRHHGCVPGSSIRPSIFTRLSAYYSWLATTAGPQPILMKKRV